MENKIDYKYANFVLFTFLGVILSFIFIWYNKPHSSSEAVLVALLSFVLTCAMSFIGYSFGFLYENIDKIRELKYLTSKLSEENKKSFNDKIGINYLGSNYRHLDLKIEHVKLLLEKQQLEEQLENGKN